MRTIIDWIRWIWYCYRLTPEQRAYIIRKFGSEIK